MVALRPFQLKKVPAGMLYGDFLCPVVYMAQRGIFVASSNRIIAILFYVLTTITALRR